MSVIKGKVFNGKVEIAFNIQVEMMDCYNSTTETNQVANPKLTVKFINFLCFAFRTILKKSC